MPDFLDPGKNPSDAVQVGQGAADEYGEAKASGSGGRERVDDIKGRISEMSDDELDALGSDERKGVQEALAVERDRRAAAASAEQE